VSYKVQIPRAQNIFMGLPPTKSLLKGERRVEERRG